MTLNHISKKLREHQIGKKKQNTQYKIQNKIITKIAPRLILFKLMGKSSIRSSLEDKENNILHTKKQK